MKRIPSSDLATMARIGIGSLCTLSISVALTAYLWNPGSPFWMYLAFIIGTVPISCAIIGFCIEAKFWKEYYEEKQ